VLSLCASAHSKPVHHYVFFNLARERIREASFLSTKAFEGAQLKYTWRELEPRKDVYEFAAIRSDLAFLTAKGKKCFIQLQDVSFGAEKVNVPEYLRNEEYGGGVVPQWDIVNGDEANAKIGGWVAKRWDPAVQVRFQKLLITLGKEFDGKIAGINLPETSLDFGDKGGLAPKDFTPERYRDVVISNMKALRQAFPTSVVLQYANFMPGEWLPGDDHSYLRDVYKAARETGVGVGGPDLLPFRRGQLNHSYPLIKSSSGVVSTGIAVQDGNYSELDPKTGKKLTIAELIKFATDTLNVDYVFWCTEEPFYSKEVIPFFQQRP